jgi:hypothetical protein
VGSRRPRVLLALALALGATGARAEDGPVVAEPLPWQDPAAVNRLFLQLPFEAPGVLPPGAVEVRLPLVYTNHLVLGGGPDLQVEIDFESAVVAPEVHVGLASGLELQAALPFQVDYGGILDAAIGAIERFVHASNPERVGRPTGLTRFRLVRPNGSGIAIDAPRAGLGDAWVGFKASVLDEGPHVPSLSIRGAVKFPTGAPGFGSGNVDLGVGVLLGWTWQPIGLWLETDLFVPTGELQGAQLAARPYGTAQLGFAWAAGHVVTLHAQMSAHLAPVLSDVDEISLWTFYVLLGASFRIDPAVRIRLGIAENILTPSRGADITGLLEASFAF